MFKREQHSHNVDPGEYNAAHVEPKTALLRCHVEGESNGAIHYC